MCDQVNTAMIFLQQNQSHAGCKTKPEISTTNIPRDKKNPTNSKIDSSAIDAW